MAGVSFLCCVAPLFKYFHRFYTERTDFSTRILRYDEAGAAITRPRPCFTRRYAYTVIAAPPCRAPRLRRGTDIFVRTNIIVVRTNVRTIICAPPVGKADSPLASEGAKGNGHFFISCRGKSPFPPFAKGGLRRKSAKTHFDSLILTHRKEEVKVYLWVLFIRFLFQQIYPISAGVQDTHFILRGVHDSDSINYAISFLKLEMNVS